MRQHAVAAVKEGAADAAIASIVSPKVALGAASEATVEPEAQYDVAFLDEDSVYLLAFHCAEADQ